MSRRGEPSLSTPEDRAEVRNGAISTMRRTRLTIDGEASSATTRPGRMGEYVVRAAAIGQHDLLEELFEVAGIVVETLSHSRAARSRISRSEPPWPRQSRVATPKPAVGQIADGLEIFLDAFVAAGQDDDGALERTGRGAKQAIADPLAVARGEKAAGRVFRRRIAGDFVEEVRHSALRLCMSSPCIGCRLGMVIDAKRKSKGIPPNGAPKAKRR